jgi:hypothetical protein
MLLDFKIEFSNIIEIVVPHFKLSLTLSWGGVLGLGQQTTLGGQSSLLTKVGGQSPTRSLHTNYEFVWQGGRFRVVPKGVLGLGLIVVYLYYEFAWQGERFRIGPKGVLGLGLIVV